MIQQLIISDAGNENLIEDIQRSGTVYAYDESVAMVDYKRDLNVIPDPSRPMWEVYIDGTYETGRILHSTGVDDSSRYIIGAKLSLEIGEPGTFSFTITPHHILYNEITPYRTTVVVYQEGVELFRGRVTGYTTDINRQRQVDCEGDLSYLSDVQISSGSIEREDTSLSDMFKNLINLYNKNGDLKEGDARYLAPGEVSIAKADYNVEAYKWIQPDDKNYKDVREYIDEFIDCFGGYLRTKRYEDGLVHVEYISGYTEVNEQRIVYGENLLEFSIDSKLDDLLTVMVVEGEEYTPDGEKKVTPKITSLGSFEDTSLYGATIIHENKGKSLVWKEGLETYGKIIRAQSFSGVKNDNELKSRAVSFFRETIIGYLGNYSLKFVDRHWLDPLSYRPVYLGQKVKIVSAPHEIDTSDMPLTCMKIEYDLSDSSSVSATFDIPFQPLADTFVSKYKQERKQQRKKTSKAGGGAKKANQVNEGQDRDLEGIHKQYEETKKEMQRMWRELYGQKNSSGGGGGGGGGDDNPPEEKPPES